MTRLPFVAYAKAERGALTVLNLFFVIVMMFMGGLAIDMASLVSSRQHLQVAADSAAQAAIYLRGNEAKPVADAKAKAIEIAAMNMPDGRYGEVLRVENIKFGEWDKMAKTFTIDEDKRGAVYVRTDQLAENANPVSAFLLKLAGFKTFDVVTTSVFETYRPTCLREGFVAQGIVDIQSGNDFTNGFCIHSNTNVEVNQNNEFEAGTIVSMPDSDNIELPSSGFTKNEGLKAALRDGRYDFEVLKHLASGRIEDGMTGAGPADSDLYALPHIDTSEIIAVTAPGNKLDMSDLYDALITHMTDEGEDTTGVVDAQGHAFEVACGNTLTMENTEVWRNVLITTDCDIKFGNSVQMIGTTILSRSTDADSIKAPNGLTIGDDDGCADGGGSNIFTYGGISQASGVSIFGSRIVALGDVAFTANNDGIEGASVVAGGRIDATSNSKMGFCGTGMDTKFEPEYFRLAG